MQEIDPREAAAMLAEKPAGTLVLDVREAVELELAAIKGALHIPMQEIPQRLDELDKEQNILCLCHSGGRSAQVAHFLEAQQFRKVFNITGGIDAWADEVDSTIPHY